MILDLNQKKHVVNKGRSQQPLEKGGVAVNTVKWKNSYRAAGVAKKG